jgi:hypothetical protein
MEAQDSGGVLAVAGAGWARMGSARAVTAGADWTGSGRVCDLGQARLWDRGATAAVQKSREH